ncbi:MAG: sulfatase [Lewinellaceae bacterium]|nr:sulfatase [Phaeodactylibacter sp.]MCB9040501.1 sulfatase [Lewinellaceae bacterium]
MMQFGQHIAILFLMVAAACAAPEPSMQQPDYSTLELSERPNIVWIVAEDLSAVIPPYGDSTVVTPNISRLAEEGVLYTQFFSPSGVCAPSRAAIATGMYPTRIGAHHMRTGPWFRFTTTDKAIANYSRKAYEAMPPAGTHMLSSYLRRAGYFCTNNPKEDYQFRCELGAWDESNFEAHWKHRPDKEQPFFAIFNLDNTHESMIWRRANDTLLVDSLLEVPVPPYLPTTNVAKRDVRRLYSQVVAMDQRVGNILAELEAAGELEKTIVFWYTDHGGPLPRQKRTTYDSGIHVPMIIRFPNRQLAGKVDSQLLSFIDLKPTVLSLAGIEPPSYVDGKAWMGEFADTKERDYVFAAADRFDNQTDKIRAVRGRRFKLVRYYNLGQPYYLPVKYRETMPIMQELLRLHEQDSLNEYQNQWFRPQKDSLELFDLWNDPHELHNIVDSPQHANKVAELRAALDHWIAETEDKGRWTEEEYLEKIWPGGQQPVTDTPTIRMTPDSIALRCATEGAQAAYQWAASEDSLSLNWTIYQSPIAPQNGKTLFIQAHRIGYRPSGVYAQHFSTNETK